MSAMPAPSLLGVGGSNWLSEWRMLPLTADSSSPAIELDWPNEFQNRFHMGPPAAPSPPACSSFMLLICSRWRR